MSRESFTEGCMELESSLERWGYLEEKGEYIADWEAVLSPLSSQHVIYDLAEGHGGEQDRQSSCSLGTYHLGRSGQLTIRQNGLRDQLHLMDLMVMTEPFPRIRLTLVSLGQAA